MKLRLLWGLLAALLLAPVWADYTDGNSVVFTPDIGWVIESAAGVEADGFPVTLAARFKAPVDSTNFTLVGIGRATGNWNLVLRVANGFSGGSTTSDLHLRGQSSGGGGSTVSSVSPTTISEDTWFIVVVRATDADTISWAIDANAVVDLTSQGLPTNMTSFDAVLVHQRNGTEYAVGTGDWVAVWNDADMTDQTMEDIASCTITPDTASPDFLVYYEGDVVTDGVAASSFTTSGTGSITDDGVSDVDCWPPAGGGSTKAALRRRHLH